jgi:hypothetical protein
MVLHAQLWGHSPAPLHIRCDPASLRLGRSAAKITNSGRLAHVVQPRRSSLGGAGSARLSRLFGAGGGEVEHWLVVVRGGQI